MRDVILRIYRQAQRGERRGEGRAGERPASGLSFSPSQRRKEREEMRNKEHHEHSTRRTLVDDCDEEVSCSYYEGEGLLSTAGCETVDVTDEYVDCAYAFLSFDSFLCFSLPPSFLTNSSPQL